MKKYLTIILILLLTIVFSGCKNNTNKKNESFPESNNNNSYSEDSISDFQEILDEIGPIILPPEKLD